MATTQNYSYSVPKVRGDHRYGVDSTWTNEDPAYIAEDAAEDFHINRDGWESKWPLVFHIFDGDTLLGRFRIEREYNPEFSAEEVPADFA